MTLTKKNARAFPFFFLMVKDLTSFDLLSSPEKATSPENFLRKVAMETNQIEEARAMRDLQKRREARERQLDAFEKEAKEEEETFLHKMKMEDEKRRLKYSAEMAERKAATERKSAELLQVILKDADETRVEVEGVSKKAILELRNAHATEEVPSEAPSTISAGSEKAKRVCAQPEKGRAPTPPDAPEPLSLSNSFTAEDPRALAPPPPETLEPAGPSLSTLCAIPQAEPDLAEPEVRPNSVPQNDRAPTPSDTSEPAALSQYNSDNKSTQLILTPSGVEKVDLLSLSGSSKESPKESPKTQDVLPSQQGPRRRGGASRGKLKKNFTNSAVHDFLPSDSGATQMFYPEFRAGTEKPFTAIGLFQQYKAAVRTGRLN